ncbi:protein of unknown function [Petrocella atlantisensis]|uniref:Uncharacterized protein n=1 Tax=Petrocella atlantisensis TaxID=2173034 RepID=A0A3P7PC39_9FIRM|nr:protein of unknown function [Petrocella atlantisensis]
MSLLTLFVFPSMLRWSCHERFASLLELSHWAIICHYFIFFSALAFNYKH